MPTRDDQTQSVPNRAWQALHEHSIVPTPHSFELFYLHFSGENLPLTDRLKRFIAEGHKLDAGDIESLYREFIAPGLPADALDDHASELADAAANIIENVSGNQRALSGYCGVLDHWAGRLHDETSLGDLLKAVSALTAETVRASARNCVLEQQLSVSGAQIARLRQDLTTTRREATTDPLTGLANRKALDAKLRRAIKQAKEDATATFSLLLLDIDHFKRFNDSYGHSTGDQVLRLVARLLSDNVKGRDTAARYGGEEFTILLTGADLAAATTVAEQIRQRLAHQRLVKRGSGELVGHVTASVGVAQYRGSETALSLIERADEALYAAKNAGRNCVRIALDTDGIAA